MPRRPLATPCAQRIKYANSRKLAYLRTLDVLPSFGDWPAIWKTLFLSPHLRMNERNRLLAFFVQNGVAPHIAGDLVLYPNRPSYQKDLGHACVRELEVGYDRHATDDILNQVSIYEGPPTERQVQLFMAYTVYNFAAGRVM